MALHFLSRLFEGIFSFGDNWGNRITGTPAHLTVDVTSADYDVAAEWQNCKGISCDTAGLIKITKRSPLDGTEFTEVLQVEAGMIYQLPFVIKVFRYSTGTTACTAKVCPDAGGTQVVGIKLRR